VASQSSCSRGSPELHKKAPVGDWPRLAEERALNDISHYVTFQKCDLGYM